MICEDPELSITAFEKVSVLCVGTECCCFRADMLLTPCLLLHDLLHLLLCLTG